MAKAQRAQSALARWRRTSEKVRAWRGCVFFRARKDRNYRKPYDHNGGKVIAGSIDLDTIGAAQVNNSSVIHITSEGYEREIVVDIAKINDIPKVSGTEALLAGMMEGAQKFGFQVGGFDAYVSTNVIAAAGVSSSASFEMLVCTIINHFFNDGAMTCADYAKIGKYSENVFWNKASGMMDQMACAVGDLYFLTFQTASSRNISRLHFPLRRRGIALSLSIRAKDMRI